MSHYPQFLHRLLSAVEKHPDTIAFVDCNGQRQVSYRQLLSMACRVAAYLRRQSFPRHSFIVVCLPVSAEYEAAELGIWMAGHAVVPTSDTTPRSRIEHIISHCSSPLLLQQQQMDEALSSNIEPQSSYLESCSQDISEDDIAALFYTSGSTGQPKAVIHTFRTMNSSSFSRDILSSVKPLVMGMTLKLQFAASNYMHTALSVGGRVVIVPPETVKDIHRLANFFAIHGVTYAFLSPSLLRHFRQERPTLQLVMVATERLSGIAPDGYRLINIYGQTETTEGCFAFDVDKAYDNTPIGRPTKDGMEYRIMDDDLQEVPDGTEGELCLRGQLSLGYYKAPELTAKLWRGGWLHTGDIVRELPDGNIVYVNRKDWMVKIRGQRVEPGEVEAVLRQMSGINDVIVKGFTETDRQYLCAYYTSDVDLTDDAIWQYLSQQLPDYMVPAYYIKMQHFPLLPNGKTDRRSLPAPVAALPAYHSPYLAPRNEAEQQLCNAFEQTLGKTPIGIDDDFFALGGDSIRVMQLQTLCPTLVLSARAIYKYHTPRLIASALDTRSSLPAAQPTPVERLTSPLSQQQLGIFTACIQHPGKAVYNNPMLFRLASGTDVHRLALACEAVVAAHPYVMARLFVDGQGTPWQRPGNQQSYCQTVETVSHEEFRELKPQLVQPFQLLDGPLFRLRIIKTPDEAYFFIDFHHIIFDGTSLRILLDDLDAAYSGKALELENWSGFEVAQREQRDRQSVAYHDAAHWYTAHFGSLDIVSLPEADLSSSVTTYGEHQQTLSIDYPRLQSVCNRLGLTPNTLTTAAFGYLLGCYNHKRESLFATVYHGRDDLLTQHTIAMMVRTLPVHAQWEADTTVGNFLQNTQQQLHDSIANGLFSFADLSSLNPAVNSHVLFVYQDDITHVSPTLGGKLLQQIELPTNATGEALFAEVSVSAGKLLFRTEYHSNRYSQACIIRLAQCYDQLLTQLAAPDAADVLLSDLALVSAEQRISLGALGYEPSIDFDRSQTLADLFQAAVRKHPQARALVYGDKQYTYQELDQLTDRIATHLIDSYHVKPEDAVGVMTGRSELMLIYPLAVMRAGAAYMPLDPHFPAARLKYMCDDAAVRLILTDLPPTDFPIADFEGDVFTACEIDDIPMLLHGKLPATRPSQRYVILYTSGSTGLPKGVVLEHHSMVNFCHWYVNETRLTPADRVMAYANFGFDCHMLDLYPPLYAGACIYIIPSDMRLDLHQLNTYLETEAITVGFMTTQVGYLFATTVQNHSLRLLSVAGEKLMPLQPPPYRLYNGYGPTECTVFTTFYAIDQDYTRPLIGRPLPGYQLYVVNADRQLVPRGVVGELLVTGQGVARGYLHPSEQDAKRFTTFDGKPCYITGDLVRWTEDGDLEYLGRNDHQVKLRGLRIELGEIELRAQQHPLVSQAVACVKEVGGIDNLCLYFVASPEYTTVDTDELRTYLSETLTDFMVPTAIMQIAHLPLTPNGKVDKKQLPVPVIDNNEKIAPETAIEQQVYTIVAEQLKTDSLGITDNLVFHGLSSLAAMRLSAVLQQQLGVHIRMADMMRQPTVRAIASLLSKNPGKALHPYVPRKVYPLMENQRGLLLEWEKNPYTTQYNVPNVFRFTDIDADRLTEALCQVVDAHPYLKAKLVKVDGNVVLQRNDEDEVQILVCSTAEEPDSHYFQKRVQPFRLLGGQLYRIEVIKSPSSVWLFLDVHHIIFDGLSANVFMNDLKKACDGHALTPEQYQAFDYALYEQELLQAETAQAAMRRMDDLLKDANILTYPPSPLPDGVAVATVSARTSRRAIDTFCSSCGITANSFLNAAFGEAMRRICRVKRPLYLTVSNGRDAGPELMHCIGMLVRTLPFVNTVAHADSLTTAAYANDIHQQLQQRIAESVCCPYTRIAEHWGRHAEVMFAYQSGLNIGTPTDQINVRTDTAKFPLSFMVWPDGEYYTIELEYDGTRYARPDMQRLTAAVGCAMQQMATARLMSEVQTVSPEEQAALLALGTGPSMTLDKSSTVVSLFLREAQRCPEAVAVVDEHNSMTYGELDRRSDLLAARLIGMGAGADSFVGVMLPRSKELLVAVLAVFKAGSAYIPLDAGYPVSRLRFMLSDSGADIVVTTRELWHQKDFGTMCQAVMVDETVREADNMRIHPLSEARQEGIAYMIYTSGTTGTPKGVTVTHAGLLNFVRWLTDLEQLNAGEQCALHTSFSFDGSLFDLLPPLTVGAALHILPATLQTDLPGMVRYFREHHIAGLLLTTQIATLMMSRYRLPLRFLMIGGERLTLTDGQQQQQAKIYNCYGPTEFTVCATVHHVAEGERGNLPIGRPMANTTAIVTDGAGRLLPRGFVGELCLTGPQLATGYWHRPQLTAERFYSSQVLDGGRIYRTGDLARWNNEGELEYLGRTDGQLKLSGHRIEPGEIEARMTEMEPITQAAVVISNGTASPHPVLTGFYTADTTVSSQSVRDYLATRLPAYMVPQLLCQLPAIPLTPAGKTDREALAQHPYPSTIHTPPSTIHTPHSTHLLNIVRQVMGNPALSGDDDLTLWGLTSLTAIRIAEMAAQQGLTVKVNDILKYRSADSIAAHGQAIGTWENGLDCDRPTVVLVQGFTTRKRLQPLIDLLAKSYNLFIFEPLTDHYDSVFNDRGLHTEDVVKLYADFLEAHLQQAGRISLMAGHSFGGELAYRLAARWHRLTGEQPAVCLLDSLADSGEVMKAIHPMQHTDTGATTEEQATELQAWNHQLQLLSTLSDHSGLPEYQGRVVYFKALQAGIHLLTFSIDATALEQMKLASLAAWQDRCPQLRIIPIEAEHFSMLDPRHCTSYADEMSDIVKSKKVK